MGTKMKNAPVYFVIAQVLYNPILSFESYLSDVQEKLRKLGYPDFKKTVSMTYNLATIAEGESGSEHIPPIQRSGRYIFSNTEGTSGFILEQNALSFQSSEYDSFNTFSVALLQGLEVLHNAMHLSFTERVGIRYLDVVVPRDNETIHQYLVPEVLGLYGKLDGESIHSFSESMSRTKSAALTSRTIIQDGLLGFPPDLQPIGLQIVPRFEQINGVHAIVDTDAFYDSREAFSLASVKEHLNTLHVKTFKAFNTVITKHALSVWK